MSTANRLWSLSIGGEICNQHHGGAHLHITMYPGDNNIQHRLISPHTFDFIKGILL